MGTSVIINALTGELTRVVKSVRSEWLKDKNKHINGMLEPLKQYEGEAAKNDANESLSQQGKRDANRIYATKETLPRLKDIPNAIKDLQEKDQRLRAQFFQIDSGIKDPAERMPTYSYLWHTLDALDPNERIARFCLAAEHDEVVVMAAMLENPLAPMVTEDVKERALSERAKRLYPKQYEAYEQIGLLLEFLVTFRDWIGRVLFGEVGVEIPVIRTNLGDAIADALDVQVTGIPAR
ncbi:MAG TPA: hypothetical protein VGQ08_17010 [Nitrospiraceae bacterium]|jgi:hypothetical protein|nr:hypothetical protein [Nitrospiraceae bacterium]